MSPLPAIFIQPCRTVHFTGTRYQVPLHGVSTHYIMLYFRPSFKTIENGLNILLEGIEDSAIDMQSLPEDFYHLFKIERT